MSDYKIKIDLNVLNHLGVGLYSNTPAVLTEIVANSWDADATEVHVTIDVDKDEIKIKDDGHGMDYIDVQNKFLNVGYARRLNGEELTPGGRQCMGRKGIGKLAMFSLADTIEVKTKKVGAPICGLRISVPELRSKISNSEEYQPEDMSGDIADADIDVGTEIILKKLNKRINKTESFLRRRLARRFSVIGDGSGFKIYMGDGEVKVQDRGFYSDIQLLWTFGDSRECVEALCENVERKDYFDGVLPSGNIVSGFIAGVKKPEQLKIDGDNNNTITVMANGRVFVEDVQKSIDDSKVFNSYLVGELRADFFDDNALEDMAVSSRQGVNENDPRYEEFLGYIKTRLVDIGDKWTEWRRELGSKEVEDEFPKLSEWYDSLKNSKHKKQARKFIGKIATARFQGSEAEQRKQKKELIKHQILAFEKLAIDDNLHMLDNIDVDKNVLDFKDILSSVEDIEASMYYSIFEQRLAVIKKLVQHSEDQVKERVVQEHIYENLWLIDPTFTHVESETSMERTLTEYLKRECPDYEGGARLDIGYRTTSNRYMVIELKKPGKNINFDSLYNQGEKYYIALDRYFKDNPDSCPVHGNVPHIEVIFLVEKDPTSDSEAVRKIHTNKLSGINAQVKTYRDLINHAEKAYSDQIKVASKIGRIREVLDSI